MIEKRPVERWGAFFKLRVRIAEKRMPRPIPPRSIPGNARTVDTFGACLVVRLQPKLSVCLTRAIPYL